MKWTIVNSGLRFTELNAQPMFNQGPQTSRRIEASRSGHNQIRGASYGTGITISALILFLLTATLAGCGPNGGFELEPVQGKVRYVDGSLIKSDQILLQLVPFEVKARGKVVPRVARCSADVSNGTFSGFTTWKFGDGAVVGKHKVVVISLSTRPNGIGEPTRAVPIKYQRQQTTPLEIEVKQGGDNVFELNIEKGGS